MELRHLRYFVAVAEHGSFSAAGVAIRISQPPLSIAIGQLERELGVTLFVRSSQGTRLTPVGHQLLEGAYRVLDDVDAIADRLERFNGGQTGRVSLAAVPSLIWSRVPALLARFEALYPGVDVLLSDPDPIGAINAVLDRSADIGLIVTADNDRLSANYVGTLEFVACGELELLAVLPLGDDIPDPMDLSEFSGRTVIVPRRAIGVPSLAEVVEEALASRGVKPSVKHTIATLPTCLPLVAAGLGAAILPEHVVGDSPIAAVMMRRIDPPLPPLKIAAVWRKEVDPTPAVAALRLMVTERNGLARL